MKVDRAIREKCVDSKIVHVGIDPSSPEGCVYVKCATKEDARSAYMSLHGWWFDGEFNGFGPQRTRGKRKVTVNRKVNLCSKTTFSLYREFALGEVLTGGTLPVPLSRSKEVLKITHLHISFHIHMYISRKSNGIFKRGGQRLILLIPYP
jgi:hypothetical protein